MAEPPVARNPRAFLLIATGITTIALAVPRRAGAQASETNRGAASDAYTNGQNRFLQHDYVGAANWFETADRLAPNSIALQNAIHAHRGAGGTDHLARAATLSLRMHTRYPDDVRGNQLAQTTISQLAPQLGRVTIRCDQCEIEVDAHVLSGNEVFVPPGHHTVLAHFHDGGSGQHAFDAAAGSTQSVAVEETQHAPTIPTAAAPPLHLPETGTGEAVPPPAGGTAPTHVDSPGPHVLTPAVFVVGAVITVGLAAGAAIVWWGTAVPDGAQLISGATTSGMANPALEMRTNSAESLTTALDVAAAGVGVVTIVIGAAFTRWSGPPRREQALLRPILAPGVAGFAVGGTF